MGPGDDLDHLIAAFGSNDYEDTHDQATADAVKNPNKVFGSSLVSMQSSLQYVTQPVMISATSSKFPLSKGQEANDSNSRESKQLIEKNDNNHKQDRQQSRNLNTSSEIKRVGSLLNI